MHHTQKTFIYISLTLILLGIATIMLITFGTAKAPAPEVLVSNSIQPIQPATSPTDSIDGSLGAQIFQNSQNPIADKVPTVTPNTNPIKDVYKNPFE